MGVAAPCSKRGSHSQGDSEGSQAPSWEEAARIHPERSEAGLSRIPCGLSKLLLPDPSPRDSGVLGPRCGQKQRDFLKLSKCLPCAFRAVVPSHGACDTPEKDP